MLSIKKRQRYLKELGFYKGEVDGIEGPLTKQAYRNLQNKYFTRKKDRDGIYGANTEILLLNAYKCKDLKHFKLTEFKCNCKTKYCTGYPCEIDNMLLINLELMRNHFNKAIHITSGLRCEKHNLRVGGVVNSKHLTGKASDFYIISMLSLKNRKKLIDYWIDEIEVSNYAYCNGYGRTKTNTTYPKSNSMGNATHVDIK